MSDLFNIPECPSPRLQWMREMNVRAESAEEGGWDGRKEAWCAFLDDPKRPFTGKFGIAYGFTEDEAIVNLAKANGWRLWHETEAGK